MANKAAIIVIAATLKCRKSWLTCEYLHKKICEPAVNLNHRRMAHQPVGREPNGVPAKRPRQAPIGPPPPPPPRRKSRRASSTTRLPAVTPHAAARAANA